MIINTWGILALLAAFSLPQLGHGLEITGLELVGGRYEYLTVGSTLKFILSCNFRSGYDDPVVKIQWLLYNTPMYTWTSEDDSIRASGVLMGKVDTSPPSEPGSLHFKKIDYSLAGNYTCQVFTSSNVVEDTYYLHVVDISPVPYETSIFLLKDLYPSDDLDESKYDVYDSESVPIEDVSTTIDIEDPTCTLVWSFKTPSIFPKPNVTCGYYSFDHDDVLHYLPAGLSMHQFLNLSWQGSFTETRVPVYDIPVNHRLGCIIKIPGTSYRELVRPEDDFTVDALIDSVGCPALEDLTERRGIMVEPRDSSLNCHGHLMSNVRDAPSIVKLSCRNGHDAVFSDGTIESDWWTEFSCYEYDQQWRSFEEGADQGVLLDYELLPMCGKGSGSSASIQANILIVLLTLVFSTAALWK